MRISISTSRFSFRDFPAGLEITLNPFGRKMTEDEVAEFLLRTDPVGLIAGVERLSRPVLEGAKSLRVISRCGAGLDSIDPEACSDLGIAVLNAPGAPVDSVAEHAVTMMLALLKNLVAANAATKSRGWQHVEGSLLAAKTVGIIGCGRIGTRCARLCAAFGARVVGYDPLLQSHPEIDLCSLETVLSVADVLSLHLPLTDATRGLVGEGAFRAMRSSAVLVNTARGQIVDESALAFALENRWISGAAIDVFTAEPYTGRLCDLDDRVLLTPHMASSTVEGRLVMEREAAENLLRGLSESGLVVPSLRFRDPQEPPTRTGGPGACRSRCG